MTEPALAAAHPAPFDYALWKEILGTIVTYLLPLGACSRIIF
jgi:hypothetical protein